MKTYREEEAEMEVKDNINPADFTRVNGIGCYHGFIADVKEGWDDCRKGNTTEGCLLYVHGVGASEVIRQLRLIVE